MTSERALLDTLFTAIDRQDTPAFLDCLAPDATFRFGSAEPVSGRPAIGEAVGSFFTTIAGLRHTLHNVIVDAPTIVCEGEVTYTRHDKSELTMPFVNVFETDGGMIAQYRIYVDIAALYAA